MKPLSAIPLDDDDDLAALACGGQIFNGPTPAAARMRRLRERRARGARIVQVEIDADLLDSLVALDLIAPIEAGNQGALAFALSLLVAESLEARLKRREEQFEAERLRVTGLF